MVYIRCRLCLEGILDNNYVSLEDFEKNMLETLTPLINLGISDEPKICDKCAKSLQTAYDFKAMWLENNERVKKLLILREIYPEPLNDSCCLCGQIIIDEMDDKDSTTWREMVENCIPELDIYSGNHVSACKKCVDDLKCVHVFLNSSLRVEDKIKDYCVEQGRGRIDLYEFFKNNLEVKCDEVIEQKKFDNAIEQNRVDDAQISDSEHKYQSNEPLEEKITVENIQAPKRGKKQNSPNQYACDQCSYVTKYRSSLVSHWVRHKDPTETTMYKCQECGHETKRKADLKAHMIIHKLPDELRTFPCPHCPYRAIRNGDLKQHSYTHEPKRYKCQYCSFFTNNEKYLTTIHTLMHKDLSELKTYKCTECPYETYRKSNLKVHHESHIAHTMPTYKCNWCEFETRYKAGLRNHMLMHTCPSELEIFECHTCGYKTKRKKDLKSHIARHYKFRMETLFCATCTFKTKDKRCLVRHMETHKEASQRTWFACKVCDFQTVRKANLASHMGTHTKQVEKVSLVPGGVLCASQSVGANQAGRRLSEVPIVLEPNCGYFIMPLALQSVGADSVT